MPIDPITLGIMLTAAHVMKRNAQKSRHSRELAESRQPLVTAASRLTCVGCGGLITREYYTTRCCGSTICPGCFPTWARAGGDVCVLCNTRHV